jgi:predicted house-cleaning noncanonical NTP pyrophosphatase (MazG superfamily)
MKLTNKLVRDRIPEIIGLLGDKPVTRILGDDEYLKQLNIKLQEEVQEYLSDESMEELADILEVIHGILMAKGKTFDELEIIRKDKAQGRGGFSNRIFLEGVE